MSGPVIRATTQACPTQAFPTQAWRQGGLAASSRALPEETPVAMSYDRVSFAVMMATPQDLADFAVGFSLTEGIVAHPSEITALDIVEIPAGIECRMSLTPARRDALAARRRHIAGPVGCGLCGLDSLQEATRPAPPVETNLRLGAQTIADAFKQLARAQELNRQTRATHAAACFNGTNLLVREDVGRHNALDKVIGAALQNPRHTKPVAILLTSRVSIELVQKTASFGAGILAAISVPTARAVRAAETANITLIAIARDDGFEIFTHPERILTQSDMGWALGGK